MNFLSVLQIKIIFSVLLCSCHAETKLSFGERVKSNSPFDFFYQSVALDNYNAFLYAVILDPPSMAGVYFRTVVPFSTQLLGGTLSSVDCAFPGRNASSWVGIPGTAFTNSETVLYSPNSTSFECSIGDTAVRIVEEGQLDLNIQLYGVEFEFEANVTSSTEGQDMERMIYRTQLGSLSGTFEGKEVSGWGGVDAMFGTNSFGNSWIFNQAEEDWLIMNYPFANGSNGYGLVLLGTNGFNGGYWAVDDSAVLLKDLKASSVAVDDCNAASAISVDAVGNFKTFSHLFVVQDANEQWGNWTLATFSPSDSTATDEGTAWWEHHPPKHR